MKLSHQVLFFRSITGMIYARLQLEVSQNFNSIFMSQKKRVHHQLDFNLKAVKFGDEIKLSVRSSSIISNFTCRRSRESRGLVTFKTETKCAKFRRSDGE